LIAKLREPLDPRVELSLPAGRQLLPVFRIRRSLAGKRFERLANLIQLHPGALRHADDRHTPQYLALIAPLVPFVLQLRISPFAS
jgi:hypothetical protein